MPPDDRELVEKVTEHTERLDRLEGCVEEIGDAVLGSRRSVFAGGDRRDDGIIHSIRSLSQEIDQVKDQLGNGGIKARLAPKDRVALWGAVIGMIGTVVAAALGAFG